jgi:Clostridium P-47 protein
MTAGTTAPVIPATGTADTNGWDTVYAITFKDVNKSIADKGSTPAGFDHTSHSKLMNVDIMTKGEFGPWQLVGGDGHLLNLTMPITSGSLTIGGNTSDLSGGVAQVQVELDMLARDDATGDTGVHDLKVKANATPAAGAPAQPAIPVAAVNSVTVPGLEEDGNGFVRDALEAWLNENLAQFDHVFASVDIGAQLAEAPGLQWLMPVGHPTYAVASHATVDDSVFAVLSMTDAKRSSDGLVQQVSPFAIPDGARAGFLIGQTRFLEHMILPALDLLFQSVPDGGLVVSKTGISSAKDLELQQWKLDDLTTVDPTVAAGDFTLTVRATSLVVEFADVTFDHLQTTCHVTFQSESSVQLDENACIDLHPISMTHYGSVTVPSKVAWEAIGVQIGLMVAACVIGAIAAPAGEVAVEGEGTVGEFANGAGEIDEVTTTFSEDADAEMAGSTKVDANGEGNALKVAGEDSAAVGQPAPAQGWFARITPKLTAGLRAAGNPLVMIGGQLIAEIAPKLLELEANGMLNDLPKLDDFATKAMTPITWPGATQTKVVNAQLNGSLQIGIDPGFTS